MRLCVCHLHCHISFLIFFPSLTHSLSLSLILFHSLSVFFHHIPRDSGLCPRCFSLFNSKLSFSTTCQSVISALRKKRKKQTKKARKRSGKVQQGTVLEKKALVQRDNGIFPKKYPILRTISHFGV